MLAKKNRLTSREDFATVFTRGKYAWADGVSIKYLLTPGGEAKIGFSVGKKYSNKATQRNHARRILREACRKLISDLKPGLRIIVMIKPELTDITLQQTSETLIKIFQKANLFK